MRRIFELAAVGLLALWPTSSANAQFTYGYDSAHYNILPSAAYFSADGYERIYTDLGTGVYRDGTSQPFRGVAPYDRPPFGSFNQYDAISGYQPTAAKTKDLAVKGAARPLQKAKKRVVARGR